MVAHVQTPLSQSQALHEHDSSPQVLQAQAAAAVAVAGFAQQERVWGCVAKDLAVAATQAPGQSSQRQTSPEQSGHRQSAQPQSAAFAIVVLEFAKPIAPAQINVAVARTAGME